MKKKKSQLDVFKKDHLVTFDYGTVQNKYLFRNMTKCEVLALIVNSGMIGEALESLTFSQTKKTTQPGVEFIESFGTDRMEWK